MADAGTVIVECDFLSTSEAVINDWDFPRVSIRTVINDLDLQRIFGKGGRVVAALGRS